MAGTTIACAAALSVSVVPGLLQYFAGWGLIVAFLLTPVVFLAILFHLLWRRSPVKIDRLVQRFTVPWSSLLIAAVIAGPTYVLLKFYVPRRVAFRLSRPAFEQRLDEAPTSGDAGVHLGERLGIYSVDEWAVDPRGGTYFRVFSSSFTGTRSWGFVHRPNDEGSPFGAAGYGFRRLGGGWYWFAASDDWS